MSDFLHSCKVAHAIYSQEINHASVAHSLLVLETEASFTHSWPKMLKTFHQPLLAHYRTVVLFVVVLLSLLL